MASNASLLDLIAHGGSLRASQDNEQQAAQTQGIQANTGLTNAQIPVQQEVAKQEAVKTQLAQRQLHDEEIQRQIWADAGKQVAAPPAQTTAPPPATGTGAAVPGMVGVNTGNIQPPQAAPPAAAPPDYLSNPRAYAMELAKRGASAPAVMAAYTQGVDLNTKISKLTKDQLDNEIAGHGIVAQSLQGYLNTPDAQKEQAYPLFYADAIAREPNLKAELPPPGTGAPPTQDDLAHVIGKVGLFGTLLANAKEKAATGASEAQAGEATAKTSEANVNAQIAQFKFGLMRTAGQATPESIANGVRGMSVFQGHPQELQDAIDAGTRAYNAALTDDPLKAAEKSQEAVKGIADRLRANSPGVIAGEVDKAKQVATATAPIEIGKAVATARAIAPIHVQEQVDTEVAKARLSPDALAGVSDPRARASAMTSYEKDSHDYADKVSAGDQLNQFVAAAQSGNKAAPGLIPIAEVRQLVSRVNRTELQSAGANAGSIFDRLQGKLNGLTEGQPIPPDVLKDIKAIGDLQARAARTNYENKVKITNQSTGAKLKPIDLSAPAETAGYQQGHVYGGLTFLGGDPNKKENWK